jgi:hypothetical protein
MPVTYFSAFRDCVQAIGMDKREQSETAGMGASPIALIVSLLMCEFGVEPDMPG